MGAHPPVVMFSVFDFSITYKKAELMLKIRATAVCNRCTVNMSISVVFSVVSCESGQNEPIISIRIGLSLRKHPM